MDKTTKFMFFYMQRTENSRYCGLNASFHSVDFLLSNCIKNLTFEQKANLKGIILRLKITQKDKKCTRIFQEK